MKTETAVREPRPETPGVLTARRVAHRRSDEGTAHDPIVAAVDGSAAATDAARTAVRMARVLAAPLVFVYVRRGPSWSLGTPNYQRRLDAEMGSARWALGAAKAVARRAGVAAEGEILEGDPAQRVVEFAHDRRARLLVLGSPRWRFGRSVARRVIRSADRPVVVGG
jgi:nucleotide-binding universal stress UspA family protein